MCTRDIYVVKKFIYKTFRNKLKENPAIALKLGLEHMKLNSGKCH